MVQQKHEVNQDLKDAIDEILGGTFKAKEEVQQHNRAPINIGTNKPVAAAKNVRQDFDRSFGSDEEITLPPKRNRVAAASENGMANSLTLDFGP